jgi:chorismate dehydratase
LDIYYQYPYRYDLAEAWMAHTGLPFVFAAWVANRPLPDDFIASFNNALEWGVDHWQDLLPNLPPMSYDPATYFSRNISYELTSQKKQGMELFLKKLLSLNSW